MKEKRRLRRIKVGCKILDTHTEDGRRTDGGHTHTRSTVVLDDLIIHIACSKYKNFCVYVSLYELGQLQYNTK